MSISELINNGASSSDSTLSASVDWVPILLIVLILITAILCIVCLLCLRIKKRDQEQNRKPHTIGMHKVWNIRLRP